MDKHSNHSRPKVQMASGVLNRRQKERLIMAVGFSVGVTYLAVAIAWCFWNGNADHWLSRILISASVPLWILAFTGVEFALGMVFVSKIGPRYVTRKESPGTFWFHLIASWLIGALWLGWCIYHWA